MIPRIKNNYVRPIGHGKDFTIEMDPITKSFDNFFIESCRVAEEIYDLKQGPLNILYSGGRDSEFTLSVFEHLGMDVVPVIVKFNPGYNDHDIKYAFEFCESKKLNPLVIDIDYDHFVKSGKILDIMLSAKCAGWVRAAIMYITESLNGSLIAGTGEPALDKQSGNTWNFVLPEFDWGYHSYWDLKGIDGTAFFLAYNQEQQAASIMDPIMQDLIHNRIPGKLGSNSSKHFMYNRDSNFNIKDRPKYHGGENIQNSKIFQHENFVQARLLTEQFDGFYAVDVFEFMKNFIGH
jgi:hypothetical protein